MKWLIVAGTCACVLVGAAALWLAVQPAAAPRALGPHTPDLANGRTMFLIGGCSACHAIPKQKDQTRLGGGLALNTSFEVFYVPNISPDRTDGIGGWSEIDFIMAMTKGRFAKTRATLSGISLYVVSCDDVR